jgi:hypothetical protein
MPLTADYSVVPENIPRIEPHTSFCTLAVYIAPNGSQQKQIQVLRQHSEIYKSSITSSTLTSEEAYYSYMMYLCPQIPYPIPCTSLTQQQ